MSCRKYPIVPIVPPPPPPAPPPGPDPGPDPEPGPDPGPTPEPAGFFYAASYYGVIGASPDSKWQSDFDRLKGMRISNLRVWADWAGISWAPPGCTVVNPDGSINSDKLNRFRRIITGAASRGIKIDLTFGGPECAYSSHDAWLRALANVATALKDVTTFYPVDVCNEFTAATYKQGVTVSEVVRATQIVKEICPHWAVTTSMDGDVGTIGYNYKQILSAGGKIDVLAPHYKRDEGWGSKVSQRTSQLRSDMAAAGITKPIYVQEENRDGEPFWSVDQSTAAASGAKASSAVGYCFHTIAGFDVISGDFFSHLKPEELTAMQQLP